MVGNSHKGDFLFVQVIVQYLERLVALLRQTSLVHEYHAIDGQVEALVAALSINSP